MTGKVLELKSILIPDQLACQISDSWIEWDNLRSVWKSDMEEIRRYIFATDTTQTTNSQLPWNNKTTIPKLCQIRDNLYSNYTAVLFPKRKWLQWEANEQDTDEVAKRDAITNYMTWALTQPSFKHEMDKIILDYIDYGNCFATVDWVDERVEIENDKTQAGYVGPAVRRISPMNIVFNPTAENFLYTPKIVRSIISLGELQDHLNKMTNDDYKEEWEALWDYLKNLRDNAIQFEGDWKENENQYRMEGFTSFREYLKSGFVEVLTFYGDIYDRENNIFLKNHVVTVVDRHKLIGKRPNPSYFGYPPIFHVPWRKRPDNLWGMGPLNNLIGLQYRLDHVENMKADIFDLVTYPVQKIKGMVEDYTWQPGEKIFVSEEGDVELVTPQTNVLNCNIEIQYLIQLMEEMAGAPREAMGFRTPGEKTKYEVQRMENAASRIFLNKIGQFSEQEEEPLYNAMLELARRNFTGPIVIKVLEDTFNTASWQALTVQDITGVGRIKPVAARHFAEQAELIQNLNGLTASNLWPFIQPHFSSKKLANIVSQIFGLEDWNANIPFVALSEQAEGQQLSNAFAEQTHMAGQTASGMGQDYDLSTVGQRPPSVPGVTSELPAARGV